MTDIRQEEAIARMNLRRPEEARMMHPEQNNAGGTSVIGGDGKLLFNAAPLTEYPRMMYRKTANPQYQDWADSLHKGSEERAIINSFDGLLCETTIAHSADEAEVLSADGWDVSPKAAHGIVTGMGAATSAKDDQIAELQAELARMRASQEQPKRGPGRPPKVQEEVVE